MTYLAIDTSGTVALSAGSTVSVVDPMGMLGDIDVGELRAVADEAQGAAGVWEIEWTSGEGPQTGTMTFVIEEGKLTGEFESSSASRARNSRRACRRRPSTISSPSFEGRSALRRSGA